MIDRYDLFTKDEMKIWNIFASIFWKTYIKKNSWKNLTDIDWEISWIPIELQELAYERSINEWTFIIDRISAFNFKDETKKRKIITTEDNDIEILKKWKLVMLPENTIYLIYIRKEKCQNIQLYENAYIKDNIIFLPLNVIKLKDYILKNNKDIPIFVNDKSKLKDKHQSAFSVIKFDMNFIYKKEELEIIFN